MGPRPVSKSSMGPRPVFILTLPPGHWCLHKTHHPISPSLWEGREGTSGEGFSVCKMQVFPSAKPG
ncbi:hypothetical protein UC8_23530 [Roseimaritima ulvae]|uniref:Uncharacterized protein n=1 Tax=Roseimaritima ulvae TaxID=980254 RepID=A0A5B9QN09_9BACT|nr:hypothetical protein UC8_23530 [Roseimaritima ulvae]